MSNEHLAQIKQRYPRAYEKWTPEEDFFLQEKHAQGVSARDLAKALQRQPSAIRSRLLKSDITYQAQDLRKGTIAVNFAFEWEPVYQEKNTQYVFPNSITAFMKENYRKPTIYRWTIERGEDEDSTFYIGEAVRLCPDRLLGYLSPGPTQQTNIRLNQLFYESMNNGATIKFEILKFTGSFINDLRLGEKDLARQDIRRLIERLLVTLYRSQGLDLLNL